MGVIRHSHRNARYSIVAAAQTVCSVATSVIRRTSGDAYYSIMAAAARTICCEPAGNWH